jgi:large subunit ribosomal protein L7/L12
MANLDKLVEELSTLTVIEAADLSKMLEEKWGVSAAAPVAVAAAAAGGGEAAVAEEQTEFAVILHDHGSWPEGSEGPGRRRAEACEGRRVQG